MLFRRASWRFPPFRILGACENRSSIHHQYGPALIRHVSNGKIDKRLLCQLAAEQDVHNCGFDVTHIRKTIATVKQAEIVPSSSASRPGSRASTPVDLPAAPLQDDFSSVGSDCSSADSSFPPTPPSIASPAPMNKDVLMWDSESGRSLTQLDSQQPLVRIV